MAAQRLAVGSRMKRRPARSHDQIVEHDRDAFRAGDVLSLIPGARDCATAGRIGALAYVGVRQRTGIKGHLSGCSA